VADKLLLISAYICLMLVGSMPPGLRLPPYVPIIIISRDAIIVLGSIIVYVVTGDLKVAPSAIGKMTTFFQMITIVAILLRFGYSSVLWNVTALFTILSGIDYIWKGSRLFGENHSSLKKGA
ncbi:MAG: hypothetical protein PHN63_04020, partial [Candidatus Omnitrophica bacterium]|nr:hypothetical protein [Candidatus Omnitrophota bacterium]